MKILAIDPGETTGYAVVTPEGLYTEELSNTNMPFGNLKGLEQLAQFLFSLNPKEFDRVIIEKYMILPGRIQKHIGSEVETIQAIGVAKAFCYMARIPFSLSDPQKNPIYMKWSGKKPDKFGAHSKTHWVYAYNHGYGYLVENKLAPTAAEKGRAMYLSEFVQSLSAMVQRLGPEARVHVNGREIEAFATNGFDLELQVNMEDAPDFEQNKRAVEHLLEHINKKDSDTNGVGY